MRRTEKWWAVSLLTLLALFLSWGPLQAQNPQVIRFGLIPSEDAAKLLQDSAPFIKQIEAALGVGYKLESFVALDYAGVVEALKFKKLEVAFLGPFAYILARDVVGAEIEPMGRGVMAHTGQSGYHALIITPAGSGITNLQELKGRTFAFVDPGSTSGNLVPRFIFKKNNINPDKDFKAVRWGGTHDGVLVAVAEGKVDAGSIADEVWDLNIRRGLVDPKTMRIVHKSEMIPGSPFVIRTDVDSALKTRLQEAFLSVKNAKFGKLGTITTMDPAKDADYNVIRDLVKELNLDLKKVK